METITWKNSDFSALRFDFQSNAESLGTLTMFGELSSNACFSTEHNDFEFTRVGYWDSKVLIKQNGHLIGEIKNRLLGQSYIQLNKGNKFRLSSNLFGRNLKWIDMKGQPIIEYKMATLNSMRKGFIKIGDSLTKNEKQILLSAGLIARTFYIYRLFFGIMAISFLFYMIDKFI